MRMLVSVELADAGTKSRTHRVLIIGRDSDSPSAGDIGLTLEEAKTLVSAIQAEFVSAQAAAIVEARRRCSCGKNLAIKDWKLRRIHTTFGRVYLPSPRVMSCTCNSSQRRAISPLKGWLARSTNELRYLAAKLASQHSYRQAAAILHDLLGVHPRFCRVSVRAATLDAGSRLDQDQICEPFADWRRIRSAPRSVTLAFDGGYARRTRKGPRRNFEILSGAGEIDGKIWVFASAIKAVAGLKRRLAAFVNRLHITSEQPIALMTDGAESLLRLKAFMPVPTRFVLDYFHVSMKLRHIDQCIGAIPPTVLSPGGSAFELYDLFNYLRGYLWSGRRQKLEESVDRLLELLDRAEEIMPDLNRSIHMATGDLCGLAWYIRKNQSGVINYGRWRKEGRRISTARDNICAGQNEERICFYRSDVPCSTASCSSAFNVGSRISDHARLASLGIGYPTILNGSKSVLVRQLFAPPLDSDAVKLPENVAVDRDLPDGRHRRQPTVLA